MATVDQFANLAISYIGHPYVYGGARPSGWDCSGFVNYMLCHDLLIPIPGFPAGTFNGTTHGPDVMTYVNWDGAKQVDGPSIGTLCCWAGFGTGGHIGVAINGKQMVSALGHAYGTIQTPIQGTGPAGVPLVFRQVKALVGGVPTPNVDTGTSADTDQQTQLQQLGQQAGCLPGATLIAMLMGLLHVNDSD